MPPQTGTLALAGAALLCVQALLVLSLAPCLPDGGGVYALWRGVGAAAPPAAGWLDARYLVAASFTLSAAAQAALATLYYLPPPAPDSARARALRLRGAARARMVEYGLSAAVAAMAVAATVGITDVYVLAQSAALTAAASLLGLLADALAVLAGAADADYYDEPLLAACGRAAWAPPLAGAWLCQAAVWGPIADAYLALPPGGVAGAVVGTQGALAAAFGGLQLAALAGRLGGEAAEQAFLALALVSRSSLGWLIIGPLLP